MWTRKDPKQLTFYNFPVVMLGSLNLMLCFLFQHHLSRKRKMTVIPFLFNFRFVNYISLRCNKIYVQNIVYLLESFKLISWTMPVLSRSINDSGSNPYVSPNQRASFFFHKQKIERNQLVFSARFKFQLDIMVDFHWKNEANRWSSSSYWITAHRLRMEGGSITAVLAT